MLRAVRAGSTSIATPEGLEHVGRSAFARGRAVAVLGDGGAGTRGHEGCRRRHVEGREAAAAASGIHQRTPRRVHGLQVRAHPPDEPGELLARLPLAAERHQERSGLHLAGLAAHDDIEGSLGILRGEALADDQALDDGREVVHRRGTSWLFVRHWSEKDRRSGGLACDRARRAADASAAGDRTRLNPRPGRGSSPASAGRRG